MVFGSVAWVIHEVTPTKVQYAVYGEPEAVTSIEIGERASRPEAVAAIAACVNKYTLDNA